ncbi:hypothetical protein BC828DRAFT_100501 [Blastocladiella britannica]|nr:hypothetical protein BC828DRAFT_100501 [Blastocladiella britannica]
MKYKTTIVARPMKCVRSRVGPFGRFSCSCNASSSKWTGARGHGRGQGRHFVREHKNTREQSRKLGQVAGAIPKLELGEAHGAVGRGLEYANHPHDASEARLRRQCGFRGPRARKSRNESFTVFIMVFIGSRTDAQVQRVRGRQLTDGPEVAMRGKRVDELGIAIQRVQGQRAGRERVQALEHRGQVRVQQR